MLKYLFAFIIVLTALLIADVYCQDIEYWGDDYFENTTDTLNEMTAPQSIVFNFAAGFFPKPYTHNILFITSESQGWNYNSGNLLLKDYSGYKNIIFNAQPTMSEGKLNDAIEEKKNFSNKDLHFFNSDTGYSSGFRYEFVIPTIRTILYGNLGCNERYYRAFSDKRQQYYLDYDGNKNQFDEISILSIEDRSINLGIGLKHPLYGFFLQSNDLTTMAYYYLIYGVEMEIDIQNKLTINDYIISESNKFRFLSGAISNRSIDKDKNNIFNSILYNYNVGIGWNATTAYFELAYRRSFNPMIKDSTFKQGILYLNVGIDGMIFKELWNILKTIF
jgi:hypothetical protein